MELNKEILDRIQKLAEKYEAMGQDLNSYLDGLLYSNSLTYWDYIHLDTLLSLQTPRTDFPDERIFIMYHQITELYFKLVRHELDFLCEPDEVSLKDWKMRLSRCVNYFKNLCHSFDVMIDGMEPSQFLKFRMSLLPASGFQSSQYRLIEFQSTSLFNLMNNEKRAAETPGQSMEYRYENIYWKSGNIEMKSGRKTLTLRMFEEKYDETFLKSAHHHLSRNLCARFLALPESFRTDPVLIALMKDFDLFANVFWRLSHYKSAVKYLQRDPEVIAATGGTNWQKFLPPRFQRIIFFPELWSDTEKEEWGKAWVLTLFKDKVENSWG